MAKTYFILVTIAVALVAIYFAIPQRHFYDAVYPFSGAKVIAYDDKSDGGTSEIEFKKGENELDFSCTLGGENASWCGLLFDLTDEQNYRNWTFVDSVIFDVESFGISEIIAKIWTYDADVTDIKKPKSFRLLMKEIPLKNGRQRIAVPFEEFYTPKFWFKELRIDTTLNRRHQETVARFEIAPGWNQEKQKKFSLKFYEISAKGVSNIFFGILMFSMLILMIIAIGKSHSANKGEK